MLRRRERETKIHEEIHRKKSHVYREKIANQANNMPNLQIIHLGTSKTARMEKKRRKIATICNRMKDEIKNIQKPK